MWKHYVVIDKAIVTRMISISDQQAQSHLWKMNAVEVLALAVFHKIPVVFKVDEVKNMSQTGHEFEIGKVVNGKIDPLLVAVLKTYDSKKKQIIYACSELIGMILNSQKDKPHFGEIMKQTKIAIFANEIRERHDVFVYSVERVSREYEHLLTDREFFLKTISFINILTGAMRAAVFKTYERYIKVAKQMNKVSDIDDIAMSILAVSKSILADINDDNQQAILSLLITFSELKGVDSVEKLIDSFVSDLKHLFVRNKNEYSRGRFYDLMVNLYDRYDKYKANIIVKGSLIHGLKDDSKMIRDKLVVFWDDKNRLELDPCQRLQQLMDIMYVNDEENIWLTNAAFLLLNVSTISSDFQRKIFEEPLQECQFAPLYMNMSTNAELMNRSQPMTPLFTQIDQMIQASQNNQQQVKSSQPDASQGSQVQTNQANSPSRVQNERVRNEDQMHQGFVRATQLPQFTQTQAIQSMLIAGLKSGHQATLSDSFYGMGNRANDKSPVKSPVFNQAGTTLFTISEEEDDKGSNHEGKHSQDSEGFIAPMPKKKGGTNLKKFFNANELQHMPMEVTQGQKIRFMHEATMPSHLARQEEVRRMQRQKFIERQMNQRKNQVSLYRQYRIGELPDIQIDFKDVIMPLMAIVRADQTIATEVFVEIFQEIYKDEKDQETREKLGDGLKNILSSSKLYDYSTMNCAHRIAMELLKIDGFTVDSAVIERTGQHSMSFQTSLILLEETIIRGNLNSSEEPTKKKKQTAVTSFNNSQITNQNKQYWFKLIKLYEIIGDQDALHGIWCELAQKDGIMFKQLVEKQEDFENMFSQGQNIDPNQLDRENEYDQREVVNLIKLAQDLKNKGKIDQALKQMENTLSNPQLCRDFDASIKRELENKSLEYKSELLKWDQIATELIRANENKSIQEIGDIKTVDMMIRSQIRSEPHWNNLTSQINNWMIEDYSKCILEKNFCYELAMFFLTSSDYDRARIFIDKESTELLTQWKNLTKLSQVAQHFLVQRIQKIYEMKEFLALVQDFNQNSDYNKDEQMKAVIKSMINWKQRCPSNSFDPINVWDDISQSRQFFIDHYCIKYENTYLQSAIMGTDFDQSLSQKTKDDLLQIQDIQVMLHIQTAKGAFKMGAYDSSDRYLKQFQTKRNSNTTNDMRIIVPIIKLKTEQCKSELRNMNFQEKMAKIDKIYRVLSNKMEQNKYDFNELNDLVKYPNLESVKTVVKSNMLKFSLQKKLLSIILTESQNDKNQAQYAKNTNYYLSESFKCLENAQIYLKNYGKGEVQTQQMQAYKVHQQGKLQFRFSKFADKLLRKMQKEGTTPQQLLKKSLGQVKKDEKALAKMVIQSGLQSLNMGYLRASDIIPRMLDVLSKYQESVLQEFIESSQHTPAWLFLRWISQIAAVLNRPESVLISNLVMQIATKYPQALYYPFQVIKSNLEINFLDQNQGQSQLFINLHKKFSQYNMLNQWSEALDCMIFPEHRFRYWFQIVCDTYQDPAMASLVLEGTQGQQSPSNPLLLKIRKIILQMYNDIMVREKSLVGIEIGKYNLSFIEKWESTFSKSFGINGCNIQSMNMTLLVTQIQNISKKMNDIQLFQGNELISKYSEWLDKFDCNEFYQAKNYIEIPGQYENSSEPISSKNVKIANVKKVCLVLGSIRRPKKITIHGSNEKDYHLLIKGGEDLRLDQRVQQLFGIINGIFKEDPSCENRDLNIKTFKVVPISNRLGSFEWVDNTEPMKALISKEHKRLENGNDINKSRAYSQRLDWLQKISKQDGQKNASAAQMHLAVLKLEEDEVVQAFKNHQAAMPFYLLRNALENLCLTSSAFLTIKNQFIKSMAVFSITSYLIGIGDRHLENFLIDTSDGEVFGIDFGIAFGSGVHLSIPELMPFRLTQQIEGVIAPHPLEGIYKQTMVHAMNAMRKKKSLILDTCEIFVKEPLLDWIKDAKQKNKGSGYEPSGSIGQQSITQDADSVLSWYPRQKIEIVKDKLLGINPVKIINKELKDSVHEKKKDYIYEIKKAIQGSEDSIRYYHLANSKHKKFLEVEDQVDILIELSRDPNILGRTWIGWSPYI